jgi:KDO2-lipid IV(A) lauroyltransferase
LRDRVHAGTQQLADAFAQLISDHPSDWHMVQRLWLADLSTAQLPS